jgi:hypothetical protein
VFAAVCATAAALGFKPIVELWLHRPLIASGLLLGGFVVWCTLEAAGTGVAAFLNAASVMRFQVATACAFAVLCFAGKAWIIAKTGIDLVPWVTTSTYLLTSAIPFVLLRRRILAGVFTKAY